MLLILTIVDRGQSQRYLLLGNREQLQDVFSNVKSEEIYECYIQILHWLFPRLLEWLSYDCQDCIVSGLHKYPPTCTGLLR